MSAPPSSRSPAPRSTEDSSALGRALALIERGGNALPHPATLFALFALAIVVLSALAAQTGLEVLHPSSGALVRPTSLLTREGLHRMLGGLVKNFTDFAPLGTVLVAMLGIGIAESSGLIATAMRLLVLSAPRQLLTYVIVFAGVLSNTASEVGYVLLVPMGAMIFQAAGRHPIAGLAAAFAGVSGGYSANLMLGTIDPLLSGLTQEAARIVDPAALVNPACNWYFMAASTLLVTFVGGFLTERVIEPRLGTWRAPQSDVSNAAASESAELRGLDASERRGLLWAGAAALLFALALLAGTLPQNGFLRDPATGSLLDSPFMKGIVALIFASAALCGLAYGIGAGTIRSDGAAIRGMSKSMETLGGYLVLVFFAAQFVAYFQWTNLGLIVAVKGAELLSHSGLGGPVLLVGFVLLTAVLNLFMGSASAKWAVMAPVFVPMFLLLGYEPALTQAAYRVGDSCTNIISPMMSYFALIIAFFQRYDAKAGIGTLVATMLPYSAVFLISWSAFLVGWYALGLPLGPSPTGP
jgi:aminobenzoyl-glutamate transport protein